jgi:hypothetical protein
MASSGVVAGSTSTQCILNTAPNCCFPHRRNADHRLFGRRAAICRAVRGLSPNMPFHETLGRPSFVYITGHWRRVFSRRSKKRRMAPIAARGCRPPKSSTPIRSIISSSNTRGVSQGVSSERSDLSGRREVTRVGGGYVAASLSQVQIGAGNHRQLTPVMVTCRGRWISICS